MRRAVTPVCVTLSLSSRTHVIRHLSLPAECARVGGSLQVMTTCPSKQVRSGDGQLSRLLGGGDMGGRACGGQRENGKCLCSSCAPKTAFKVKSAHRLRVAERAFSRKHPAALK